jgi:peroxiredoxin Q/BCP
MELKVGELAPPFSLPCEDSTIIDLYDLRGKNVVLYFYPKDDTPGCTIEAQDFSSKIKEFEKYDAIVLGISKDDAKSHCNFIEKYQLSISLLSDDGEICQKYGVIKEKSMFGKKYFGIDRSTFLIDKKGKIVNIWRSVKVNGHVKEVLSKLSTIK